jgi:hypothetical protein
MKLDNKLIVSSELAVGSENVRLNNVAASSKFSKKKCGTMLEDGEDNEVLRLSSEPSRSLACF